MTSLATAFVTIKADTSGFAPHLLQTVKSDAGKAGTEGGKSLSSKFSSALKPDTSSFRTHLSRTVGADADKAGVAGGKSLSSKFSGALKPDMSRFRHQLTDGASRGGSEAGEKAGRSFSSGMSGHIKALGGLLAGTFAVSKGVDFFKGALAEATESQKVGAQTAAVIKSTGGAAKISAAQIGDLSTAISNKAGIDDEAIQSGANLLLTFKNIKNEAGKGNDIFSQTTSIMTDMSAAMGKDPKASAIALGKALNDPVKGMTALSKVGVTFTAQQKATNKALVEGGDQNALMAMGLIGSTTEWNLAVKKNNGDIAKTVDVLTNKLTPAQKKHYQYLTEGGHTMQAQKVILHELNTEFKGSAEAQATPAEKAAVAWGNFKELLGTAVLPIVGKVADFLSQKLIPAMTKFVTGMQNGTGPGGKFAALLGRVRDVAVRVGTIFREKVLPIIVRFGKWMADNQTVVATFVGALAGFMIINKIVKAVEAFNLILAANPIGLVVVALAALAAGFIYAYKHSATFHHIVVQAWDAIKTATSKAWNNVIKPALSAFGWFMKNVLGPTIKWLYDHVVKTYFRLIGAEISFAWNHVIKPIFAVLKWYIEKVLAPTITWLWKKVVKPAFDGLGTAISWTWSHVIKPVFDTIKSAVGQVGTAFSKAVGGIKSIWATLRRATAAPVNFIIGTVYNNGIRKALNLLPGVNLHAAQLVRGFATGGFTGPGGKYDPAGIVHKGEFVHDQETTQRARPVLEAIHRTKGRMFGYADGGLVLDRARSGLLHWGNAVSFAKSQVGKPYTWGGVGPHGYDCSGFMSAITNVLRGNPPHSRVGSTASFPWPGFVQGPGEFTIGSTNRYPGSSVGHMAGTLRGMNVESRGGQGVITGPRARGYNDPGFNKHYHIGAAGNFGTGGSGSMSNPLQALHIGDWIKRLKGMGGFGSMMAGIPGHLVGGLGGFVKKMIRKAVGVVGDAAGQLFGSGVNLKELNRHGPVAGGVRRYAGVAQRALVDLGQSPNLLGDVLYRMNKESGGAPKIINTTDSNMRAGHPSVGLMQVIRGTYAAYKPRGRNERGPYEWGVSVDPYSNIYAGLNYALHRYPSIAYAMNKPGGYDQGGIARGRGVMVKNTIQPERVLSPQQTRAFDKLADSLGQARGSQRIVLDVGGGKSFTGYIEDVADDRVAVASEFAGTRRRMR